MDVGDLINSLNDLVNTFEDAVIRLDDVNKKLIDTSVGLEAVSNESDVLKGNYDNLNKNYEELNKKISDTIGSLQNLNKKMNEERKPEPSSGKNDRGEVKTVTNTGGGNIVKPAKTENKAQIGSLISDVLNRAMYGGRSLSMQSVGKSLGLKSTGVLAAVDTVIKVIEFGIKKAAEYMVLEYENQMRALEAITTSNVNSMKANLALWQNSLNGAYEAQNLVMSSNLKMIEAQNATDLANTKLRNSWFKWIPIYGTVLDYQEKEMAKMQELQQKRLQQMQQVIEGGETYAKQNDEYLKKQDQAIRDYARSVGLSIDQTEGFEDRMLSLGTSLSDINYSIEQVLKMQSQIQQQSGRIINYSNEQYEKLGSLGKIMGDETVARIQSEMVIFNQSVDDSAKTMEGMYNYANTMGISQKKLSQDVVNNLKLANKYQFKNGIQGYIEFAKWTENVRFNISQLGSVLEKIQTGGLEGVIKQSAQLQVLGGNIGLYADPLRMAYNSFMDPGTLAKDIYESLKGEGAFDTRTGDITRGIASQMRVRAAAEARGMSYEDMVTMIREETKKQNIGEELRGSNLSTEQINAIANAAQYNQETQQWYVNDLEGQSHSLKELEQTPQLLERILSSNKDEQMVDYAKATLSATERIAATSLYISTLMGGANFSTWNDTINMTNDKLKEAFSKNLNSVSDTLRQVYGHNLEATEEQIGKLENLGTSMAEAYAAQARAAQDVERIKDLLEEEYGKAIEKNEVNLTNRSTTSATQEARERYGRNSQEYKEANYQEQLADWMKWRVRKDQGQWWNKWFFQLMESSQSVTGAGLVTGRTAAQIRQDKENAKAQYSPEVIRRGEVIPTAQDAVASAGGVPMAIAANNITSIQDGLASADKRDTAIFAKTGGPFDKLFNGIFGKVNAIYDKIADVAPAPFKPIMEYAKEGAIGIENQIRRHTYGGGDNSPIRFETLKIEMNGHLELSSGGQSVDIMNELQNNPLLIREVAKMISDSLSAKFYGGKAKVLPGQNTYFK